jgi:hypothetical protein
MYGWAPYVKLLFPVISVWSAIGTSAYNSCRCNSYDPRKLLILLLFFVSAFRARRVWNQQLKAVKKGNARACPPSWGSRPGRCSARS